MDGKKIYSRFNKRDIDTLVRDLRRKPLDKTHLYIYLGNDLYLESTRGRCYLNALIFTVLDDYKIPVEYHKDFIYDRGMLKGDVKNYMKHCLETLLGIGFEAKNVMLSHILADIKSTFGFISIVCNGIVTADHSVYDYAKMYELNETFRKIFTEPVFKPSDTPWDCRRATDRLIELFKSKTIDLPPLTDFLRYGVKVSPEQIMFFFCYDIAPNFLNMREALRPMGIGVINGISNIWSIFVLDNISRLAIIMGKVDVKVTGVQSKRFSVCLADTKLNAADTRYIIDDCGNHDYIRFKIEKPSDLSFFKYKWFYDPATNKKLGWINETRTDLIGQEVNIRSFMLCRSETVCKECYGYNWEMVADTPLYKGNFSLYVLQEFNKKMQKVISVKHHCGWVYTDMWVDYNGDHRTMDDLIKNSDLFVEVDYNIVRVNPKYSYEFIPFKVVEDKKGKKTSFVKEKLFIDGKEFVTSQTLKPNGDHSFIYTVPNNSVLLQAESLSVAINKHSSINKATGKADFDSSLLKDKDLSEQAKLMFLYERTKVDMNHFIYYEALIHALIRDADNPNKRPDFDTKNLMLMHADHALTKPERNNNISTILPHGYINGIFNTINAQAVPNEMDILYQNLTDRQILKKNLFSDFNAIIDAARFKNDHGVDINVKDNNMTTADMMDMEV